MPGIIVSRILVMPGVAGMFQAECLSRRTSSVLSPHSPTVLTPKYTRLNSGAVARSQARCALALNASRSELLAQRASRAQVGGGWSYRMGSSSDATLDAPSVGQRFDEGGGDSPFFFTRSCLGRALFGYSARKMSRPSSYRVRAVRRVAEANRSKQSGDELGIDSI